MVSCNNPDAVFHFSQPYWLTLEPGFNAWALRHKNRPKPSETDILPMALIDRLRKLVLALTDDLGELLMLGRIFI
jgi:hypothetical protein